MKHFRIPFLFIILVFAGTIALDAQDNIPPLAIAEQQPVSVTGRSSLKTTPVKRSALHLAAGQHTASFEGLEAYISDKLEYPKTARKQAIEGRVSIQIEISSQGKITSAKVVESLGYGCDEAALQLVRNMPDWTPASNYGYRVKSKQMLSFDFRLQ